MKLVLLILAVLTLSVYGKEVNDTDNGGVSPCLNALSSLEVELYYIPECESATTVIGNVLDVVENVTRDINSSQVSFQVTPILCTSSQTEGCSIYERIEEVETAIEQTGIDTRSSDILCFQKKYSDKPSMALSFIKFLQCINRYDSDVEALRAYCWTTYQDPLDAIVVGTDCNEADQQFQQYVTFASEGVHQLGIVDSPTLYINGKRYCGSFSIEDIEAAVCTAATTDQRDEQRALLGWELPIGVTSTNDDVCEVWWNATNSSEPLYEADCFVRFELTRAQIIPMLAVLFFVLATVTFLFMILTRRRLDAMLQQQRHRETSGNRIQELLSILAASRTSDSLGHSPEQIEAALASLSVKKFVDEANLEGGQKSSDPADDSLESTCTICLENFTNGDDYYDLSECEHVFHIECLKKWIQKKNECPICRRRILNLPDPVPTSSDLSLELQRLGRGTANVQERVINFTTSNGTSVTISVSPSSPRSPRRVTPRNMPLSLT